MATYHFNSWTEFVEAAADVEANHPDRTYKLSSGMGEDFTGSASFAEALGQARTGWAQGRELVSQALSVMPRLTVTRPVVDAFLDVVGDWDMGRVMADVPECGWDWRESDITREQQGRMIRVVANASTSAAVKTSAMAQRGAAVCALVDALEEAGHRVQVEIAIGQAADYAYDGKMKPAHEGRIIAKRFEDPLQQDQMAFALVHGSTYRRLAFTQMEMDTPFITKVGSSYGYPCEVEDKGDIYLGCALWRERDWNKPATTAKWLRETLTAQGVEFEGGEDAPLPSPAPPAPKPPSPGGTRRYDVIGKSFPKREQLKALGGRWGASTKQWYFILAPERVAEVKARVEALGLGLSGA